MSKKSDKSPQKDLLKNLETLGLSDKESRVYLALLSGQNTGTSNLIRATGLHGQFVYTALERLEELGLARHVVQSGRKKFSANSPERIIALVEEKKLTARAVVQQIQQQFTSTTQQGFEVFQGDAAFVTHEFALLETVPEGASIDILAGQNHRYVEIFGSELNEYERLRIEKKVRLRYISTSGNSNYLKIMAQTRPFFEYRILPEADPHLDTHIYEEKINFMIYGNPVVAFTFVNKEIARGYKGFFEVLWNLSTK